MNDSVYIRNKQRARSVVNNRLRASQKYTPEYVKRGVDPVERDPVDFSDTLWSQRAESPPPRPPPQRRDPPAPPRAPVQQQVHVGQNQSWYDDSDPNRRIPPEEVSSPPREFYDRQTDDRQTDDGQFMANTVSNGDFCVVVRNDIVFTSPNLEEVEEAVQVILYDERAAQPNEVAVFQRLGIKLGVSVR